jgi:hypothetical protein
MNELNERRTRAGQHPYEVIPGIEVFELDRVAIVYMGKRRRYDAVAPCDGAKERDVAKRFQRDIFAPLGNRFD